jgi:hypothetical protein
VVHWVLETGLVVVGVVVVVDDVVVVEALVVAVVDALSEPELHPMASSVITVAASVMNDRRIPKG